MTPIRPSLAPSVPASPAPRPTEAARLAAQKAFFEIAAGRPAAPAAAAAAHAAVSAPAAQARAAAPVNRLADAPAEQPARPLRPGSLLDIRV